MDYDDVSSTPLDSHDVEGVSEAIADEGSDLSAAMPGGYKIGSISLLGEEAEPEAEDAVNLDEYADVDAGEGIDLNTGKKKAKTATDVDGAANKATAFYRDEMLENAILDPRKDGWEGQE